MRISFSLMVPILIIEFLSSNAASVRGTSDIKPLEDGTAANDTGGFLDNVRQGEQGRNLDQTSRDIVSTLVYTYSDFTTLVIALATVGLVDAFAAPNGPFTVFAPQNEAFASLPDGIVDALLLPENSDTLTHLLLYHVVSGTVLAADLSNGQLIKTINGHDAFVTIRGNTILINDSTAIRTDLIASNGVVHEIDAVLIPPDFALLLEEPVLDDVVGIAIGNPDNLAGFPSGGHGRNLDKIERQEDRPGMSNDLEEQTTSPGVVLAPGDTIDLGERYEEMAAIHSLRGEEVAHGSRRSLATALETEIEQIFRDLELTLGDYYAGFFADF